MPEENLIKSDIDSMFASLQASVAEPEKASGETEEGKKEEGSEENAGVSLGGDEQLQTEEGDVPEEKTEEGTPETEEEGEGEQPVDEEKAALIAAVKQMQEELAALKQERFGKKEEKKEPPKEYSFVTEDNFDDTINTVNGLNKVLSTVFNSAQETFLSNVPAIVARVVDERVMASNAASRFISENKDLFEDDIPAGVDAGKVKQERWDWLQKQVSTIQAERPELSNDPYKLLTMAGDSMRRIVGKFKKSANKEQPPTQRKRTPFPNKAGSRATVPEKKEEPKDKIKSAIEDMMSVIQP